MFLGWCKLICSGFYYHSMGLPKMSSNGSSAPLFGGILKEFLLTLNINYSNLPFEILVIRSSYHLKSS
jgi:hypothetical protein